MYVLSFSTMVYFVFGDVYGCLHSCKPFLFYIFTFVNIIDTMQSWFMEILILVYKKKKKLKIFTWTMGHQNRACFLLGLGFTILNVPFCVKKQPRSSCPIVYVNFSFSLHLWFTCIFFILIFWKSWYYFFVESVLGCCFVLFTFICM